MATTSLIYYLTERRYCRLSQSGIARFLPPFTPPPQRSPPSHGAPRTSSRLRQPRGPAADRLTKFVARPRKISRSLQLVRGLLLCQALPVFAAAVAVGQAVDPTTACGRLSQRAQ